MPKCCCKATQLIWWGCWWWWWWYDDDDNLAGTTSYSQERRRTLLLIEGETAIQWDAFAAERSSELTLTLTLKTIIRQNVADAATQQTGRILSTNCWPLTARHAVIHRVALSTTDGQYQRSWAPHALDACVSTNFSKNLFIKIWSCDLDLRT